MLHNLGRLDMNSIGDDGVAAIVEALPGSGLTALGCVGHKHSVQEAYV
jgi:hypothetical protein